VRDLSSSRFRALAQDEFLDLAGRGLRQRPEWVRAIGAKSESGAPCSAALSDVAFRSDEVAQSLLGCIAPYVSAALYTCLGAAATTFRMLPAKWIARLSASPIWAA
jgi:hypothetical protein